MEIKFKIEKKKRIINIDGEIYEYVIYNITPYLA
jgi:hypothetical protein